MSLIKDANQGLAQVTKLLEVILELDTLHICTFLQTLEQLKMICQSVLDNSSDKTIPYPNLLPVK